MGNKPVVVSVIVGTIALLAVVAMQFMELQTFYAFSIGFLK